MKKTQFGQAEINLLLNELDLTEINLDWIILLIAKTGIRYGEALAITPADFDFEKGLLTINKAWFDEGFRPLKTPASARTVEIDGEIAEQFGRLLQDKPSDMPVFTHDRMAAVNGRLRAHCKKAKVPIAYVYSLRHALYQQQN